MLEESFVGHVHLRVGDLERSERFYVDVLGFSVTERVGRFLFLSAGERHHDVALQEIRQAPPAPTNTAGLYHFAIEVRGLAALAAAYRRLLRAEVDMTPVDHGISRSLYFSDPDGNGIEIYVDTRDVRSEWRGITEPLDLEELLGH